MRTYIRTPEEVNIRRLPTRAEEESSPNIIVNDALCNPIINMAKSVGCKNENRTPLLETICTTTNAILEMLGCNSVEPEEEIECYSDESCKKTENCVNNKCVVDKEHCDYTEDCENHEECDLESGDCRPLDGRCSSDSHCSTPTSICNTETHECIECLTEDHCELWENCDDKECIEDEDHCRNNSECEQWELCIDETGDCVNDEDHCYITEECNVESYWTCDLESGDCYVPSGRCRYNSDCVWEEDEKYCENPSHECVECIVDNHCPPEKPNCGTYTHICS